MRGIQRYAIKLIKDVLTRAGVEFIDENGGGAGVRLRKADKKGPKKTGGA